MYISIKHSWEVFFVLIATCFGVITGTIISVYHSVFAQSMEHLFLRPLVGLICGFASSVVHLTFTKIIDRLTRGKYQQYTFLQALQFTLIMYFCLMVSEFVFFKDSIDLPSHRYWIIAATFLACVVSLLIFISHRLATMIDAGLGFIKQVHIQVIKSLVHVLEARDSSKKGHSGRVSEGCELLARKFGSSEEVIEQLKRAALMHDLGMLFIDESLIQKDTALTPHELAEIRLHPFIVERILAPLNILSWETRIIKASQFFIYSVNTQQDEDRTPRIEHMRAVKTFLEHSLPDKKMEDMPFEARILSAVDFFDTLTHPRPYRGALTVEETLRQMKEQQGTRFDEKVVTALTEMIEKAEWPSNKAEEEIATPEEERIVREVQSTAKNLNIRYSIYKFMGSGTDFRKRALLLSLITAVFLATILGIIIYANTSEAMWIPLCIIQGLIIGIILYLVSFSVERSLMIRFAGKGMGGLPGTWLSYSAGGLVASAVSFYSIVFPAAHYTSYFSPLAILYIVTTTALSGAIGIFYRYLRDLSHDLLKNQEKIQKIFLDLVLSLSYALESADPYTKGHSEKVCIYARKLGEFLGLPGEQLDELEKAALLHDIGKMGISKLILNKPSKLTDDEYAIIKTHSEIGARTLELVMTLSPLAPIIKAHHESFDGLGYPERIMKEEIPLYARIIAIADSYDAMISNRAYRKGLSHDMAIEELRRCAGTQFDPQLVEAFIKSME